MRYGIQQTSRFKKQLKLMKRRGGDPKRLLDVIDMLADGKILPEKYRNHRLVDSPRFQNCWECHVAPDWLLVYRKNDTALVLLLLETGTHSDLF